MSDKEQPPKLVRIKLDDGTFADVDPLLAESLQPIPEPENPILEPWRNHTFPPLKPKSH